MAKKKMKVPKSNSHSVRRHRTSLAERVYSSQFRRDTLNHSDKDRLSGNTWQVLKQVPKKSKTKLTTGKRKKKS